MHLLTLQSESPGALYGTSESSKSFGQGCFQVLVFMEAKAGNKGVSRDANSNNISVRDNIHTDYSVNQNKLQKLRELELIVKEYMVYCDATLMGKTCYKGKESFPSLYRFSSKNEWGQQPSEIWKWQNRFS